MLTKNDIVSLLRAFSKVFATKKDFEQFATKKDLNRFAEKNDLKPFATKDDLKPFATKDDLKPFATKDDLKPFATKDDLKPFATKDDLKPFATKNEMNKQHDEVMQKLDRIQEDITSLTEATGNILSWTDDIHNEIVKEKLPQRVHRIEKHLGFPVLAD